MLQEAAALALVGWAAWVLGRCFWVQFAAGGEPCGGCGGSATCDQAGPDELLQVEIEAPAGGRP